MKKTLIISCVYLLIISESIAKKRVKRIFNGLLTFSHDFYDTHYIVSLQNTHGCASDEWNHKLEDCLSQHICGGSLITEDFVLTACHCLVYDQFYMIDLPPIDEINPDEIISYLDDPDRRLKNHEWAEGDPIVFKSKAIVKHPLLNSMTIWAGGVELSWIPQKRHASSFFPHHLCAPRQEQFDTKNWKDRIYEMDVGLVKTCYPFKVNDNVRLAPISPYATMEQDLNRVIHHSHTCMTAGWGKILLPKELWSKDIFEHNEDYPELLHHAFRFLNCRYYCGEFHWRYKHHCVFCSSHHGETVNAPAKGDSGSPIVCDGFVTGVNSWSEYEPDLNTSATTHVAVACIKELLQSNHLAYLRSRSDTVFHWQNGEPVLPTNPP